MQRIPMPSPRFAGKFLPASWGLSPTMAMDAWLLLSYKDDIDLETKLEEWENFYNFNRPHGAFNGKTPYEALREKL
jgi:transposase InsO family protein